MAVQGTSGFNCLPTELQAMICAYLSGSDLLNWRLVSRSLGAVGAKYLLPTVYMYFDNSSFAQLRQIFKNSTVCSGVYTLQYSLNSYILFDNHIEDWEQFLLNIEEEPQSSSSMPTVPTQAIADYDPTIKQLDDRLRLMLQNQGNFSADQFVQICKAYQSISEAQYHIRLNKTEHCTFTEAFKRMPNLKAVTLDMNPGYGGGICSVDAADDKVLWYFKDNIASGRQSYNPPGVSPLRSLLSSVTETQHPLEKLDCKLLSWRVFSQREQDFTTTTAGLQQFKYLNLEIDPRGWDHYADDDGHVYRYDYDGTQTFNETPYAGDYLQNGRVIKFLSSAPNLEYLNFQWTFAIRPHLELKCIMGTHTWPNLRSLALTLVDTADADLRHFLRRHAGTLEEVDFSGIHLNDGLWAPVFLFMRLELSLRAFRASMLTGLTEEDVWVDDGDADFDR